MALLPDLTFFGTDSDISLVQEVEIQELDEAGLITDSDDATTTNVDDVTPLGVDFAFDFSTGEFAGAAGSDLRITSENRGLEQWTSVALLTPRGQDIIFPDDFGSTINEVIGIGIPMDGVAIKVPSLVREALLVHDRIEAVDEFNVQADQDTLLGNDGALLVSFRLVRDDTYEQVFEGLTIG